MDFSKIKLDRLLSYIQRCIDDKLISESFLFSKDKIITIEIDVPIPSVIMKKYRDVGFKYND